MCCQFILLSRKLKNLTKYKFDNIKKKTILYLGNYFKK